MTRLEDLFLVLATYVHSVVDVFVVNLNSTGYFSRLERVLVLLDDHLRLLFLSITGRSYHVGKLLYIVRPDELRLQRGQVVLLHRLDPVCFVFLRSKLGAVL